MKLPKIPLCPEKSRSFQRGRGVTGHSEWRKHENSKSNPVIGGNSFTDGLRRRKKPAASTAESEKFAYEEATILGLGREMAAGKCSAAGLVAAYLRRIAEIDRGGPGLGAVIELNPDADDSGQLDRERKAKGPRGALHGIPVLIKDNIDTADRMNTTAGSLALAGHGPPATRSSSRLRAAGAVIIGKTNLSEWANLRSTHSSSGWSGRGGQTRNPYALDRNPSRFQLRIGRGVAANLVAVAVGTETDGSMISPVVGLRHCRAQAHGGTGQPFGDRSHCPFPGHGRPHGAHRERCRPAAECDGRPRSRRPRNPGREGA